MGSRVGRRIKASDCSAAALATDGDLLLDPAELRVDRAERQRRLAPLGQQRPAGGAGRLRGRLAAAAGRWRARLPAPRCSSRRSACQLRRLAFEAEQARRDRADLLERERQRERLGRGRRRRQRPAAVHRRASSRARRRSRAGPARRRLPGRSAAGPTGSSPATGCSRRWQSSRTPCPLLQTDAASDSAPRRSQGLSGTLDEVDPRAQRAARRAPRRCNGLFGAETLAQVHARRAARCCKSLPIASEWRTLQRRPTPRKKARRRMPAALVERPVWRAIRRSGTSPRPSRSGRSAPA